MKWHVIYTEAGKVSDCEIESTEYLKDAEESFTKLHPAATWWELGMPLIEANAKQHLPGGSNGNV